MAKEISKKEEQELEQKNVPPKVKELVKKTKKEFSELVIREIMVQKNMTYEDAKAHLEKYHR